MTPLHLATFYAPANAPAAVCSGQN